MYDFAIVGGGIVGLSVGKALCETYPNSKIVIIEKEDHLAAHQTGHNSGVIHSGIYYKPGSFKAKFAKEGSQSMVEFCQQYGIEHDICGKVIVATKQDEISLIKNLYERGLQNGLNLKMIGPEEMKEIEPHVNGLRAIHVPMAGIVNYKQVCLTFAKLIKDRGSDILTNTRVENIVEHQNGVEIETDQGTIKTQLLINCAGLHSDRVAKLDGVTLDMKIVPFRGEYYELKPEKRYLVKNLIYPVPNPSFPFLGVHFTRMIGGKVEAGPNAVLSFKREGYLKSDFNLKDISEVMIYSGFWKLASKYWRDGFQEMVRSYSKAAFVRSMQELIPEIREEDVEPSHAGVRAQAVKPDGTLVDDFAFFENDKSVHVCNAPSPAATASIQIGRAVADRIQAKIGTNLEFDVS